VRAREIRGATAELLSAVLVVAARPSSSSSSAAMGIPATIIGGVWGVSVVCGVNALRQVRFFKSAPPHPLCCPTTARPARRRRPARRAPIGRPPPARSRRARSSVAAEPWEHVIGGIAGMWFCNQLVIAADKLDTAVKRKMMAKLDANKDVMDVNYRGILQKNYDKWFPSSEE
jgi:hypothetical protein